MFDSIRGRAALAMLSLLTAGASVSAQALFPPLKAEGLTNAAMMQNLYRGRFDRMPLADPNRVVPISDDAFAARKAFMAYVVAYSDQCQQHLPANKIQVVRVIVTYNERTTSLMRGLVGMPLVTTTTREEVSRRLQETGIYAAPEFHAAYVNLANAVTADAFVTVLRDLARGPGDSLGAAGLRLIQDVLQLNTETHTLLARHGCKSQQAEYYGRNLLSYVSGSLAPAYREETFLHHCRAQLAAYVPGGGPAHCACLQGVFGKRLAKPTWWDLEDNFTEEKLLAAAVSRVGLHKEVGACLR